MEADDEEEEPLDTELDLRFLEVLAELPCCDNPLLLGFPLGDRLEEPAICDPLLVLVARGSLTWPMPPSIALLDVD